MSETNIQAILPLPSGKPSFSTNKSDPKNWVSGSKDIVKRIVDLVGKHGRHRFLTKVVPVILDHIVAVELGYFHVREDHRRPFPPKGHTGTGPLEAS